MYYGIDCKAKLQEAMITCGLMNADARLSQSKTDLKQQSEEPETRGVRDWLKSSPSVGYRTVDIDGHEHQKDAGEKRRPMTQPVYRISSYVQTLVMPDSEHPRRPETSVDGAMRRKRKEAEMHSKLERRYSLQGGRIYPDYLKQGSASKEKTEHRVNSSK
jgi:hypothetical protein